jgi:hypothetical protein
MVSSFSASARRRTLASHPISERARFLRRPRSNEATHAVRKGPTRQYVPRAPSGHRERLGAAPAARTRGRCRAGAGHSVSARGETRLRRRAALRAPGRRTRPRKAASRVRTRRTARARASAASGGSRARSEARWNCKNRGRRGWVRLRSRQVTSRTADGPARHPATLLPRISSDKRATRPPPLCLGGPRSRAAGSPPGPVGRRGHGAEAERLRKPGG